MPWMTPPKKWFVLPKLKELRDCSLLSRRKKVYLVKLDVRNYYGPLFYLVSGEGRYPVRSNGKQYMWRTVSEWSIGQT